MTLVRSLFEKKIGTVFPLLILLVRGRFSSPHSLFTFFFHLQRFNAKEMKKNFSLSCPESIFHRITRHAIYNVAKTSVSTSRLNLALFEISSPLPQLHTLLNETWNPFRYTPKIGFWARTRAASAPHMWTWKVSYYSTFIAGWVRLSLKFCLQGLESPLFSRYGPTFSKMTSCLSFKFSETALTVFVVADDGLKERLKKKKIFTLMTIINVHYLNFQTISI